MASRQAVNLATPRRIGDMQRNHYCCVSEIFFLGRFGLDAGLTAAAAWLLGRTLAPRGAGLEQLMGWGLSLLLIVAASGELLSWGGGLGATGFLLAHAAILLALAGWRGKSLTDDTRVLGALGAALVAQFQRRDAAAWLGAGLFLFFIGLFLLAAPGQPVLYDALTYRLARIGIWLQDGGISPIAADDARLNYMPVAPDLVMAWLLGAHASGYHWAALAQTFGGGLTLGATAGLARHTGLSRAAALGAAALLWGLANVAPQFTSLHTDLFTTGVLASAFYLWLAALHRGEGSILGGLGAGLALGCKGTVLYLGPGALLWVGWLAWRHPLPWRAWNRTLLAAALGAGLYAAPVHWRNWREYGGLFGPAAHVVQHHAGAFVGKLELNLRSAFVQSFDPNSQPWGLQLVAGAAGRRLAAAESDDDRLVWEHMRRRTTLQQIMMRATPDADVTSFGLIPLTLFGAGIVVALLRWRREESARLVIVWAAGLGVFFLFFHGMQQWHPFGFRYFVLMAPWLAVVAAWGIERQRRGVRVFLWGIAAWTIGSVLWIQNTQTAQTGWLAAAEPERTRPYHVYRGWRDWAEALPAERGGLTVALTEIRPLAAFYRGDRPRPVVLAPSPAARYRTAADFSRASGGGWVIVPATRFLGNEGAVQARVWLDGGDEAGVFSLAAYRLLPPGAAPAPIFYRWRRARGATGVSHSLLVKTWPGTMVRLGLHNPGSAGWRYECLTPSGRQAGLLAAAGRTELTLDLGDEAVSEVIVRFVPLEAGAVPEPEIEWPAPASAGG